MNTTSLHSGDLRTRTTADVSIGVMAWNEEEAIGATLRSLLAQDLFSELTRRGLNAEVVCVANGCTDQTVREATRAFAEHARSGSDSATVIRRVADVPERGKVNAWNRFVHDLSDPNASFLFLMDADIRIHRPDTLWRLLRALEQDPGLQVAVSLPRKHLEFKERKSALDRLSLRMAKLTTSSPAQLCGQLYCIRAGAARRLYLPRAMPACEDGLIKCLVCTDLLSRPSDPARVRTINGAEHTFEAYTSPAAILKNQKRQIIGQTAIHLLVDRYLPELPAAARSRLADTLRAKDESDPAWLQRLIAEHVRHTWLPWQLYPGLLTHRLRRWAALPARQKAAMVPALMAGFVMTLTASFLAFRFFRKGAIEYWPRARRSGFGEALSAAPTCQSHEGAG